MRHVLSIISLLLAALLAAAALAGGQVNQLLRSEEPVRGIAGSLPEDDDFARSVTTTALDELAGQLPSGVQDYLPTDSVEGLLTPVISDAFTTDRALAAWDEVLQGTRSDYTAQLEGIFESGTQGDVRELDIELNLTPVSEAMTEPLRESLHDALGWVPGVDLDSFDMIAPDIVLDIEAATDETADPYTWATVAVASQYWGAYAIGAAVLALIGVLVGAGRIRWYAMASGGVVAAIIGLWMATTVASPQFEPPPETPAAAVAILEHIQHQFTEWAQPAWWVFSALAGVVVLAGMLVGLLTPTRRR